MKEYLATWKKKKLNASLGTKCRLSEDFIFNTWLYQNKNNADYSLKKLWSYS